MGNSVPGNLVSWKIIAKVSLMLWLICGYLIKNLTLVACNFCMHRANEQKLFVRIY